VFSRNQYALIDFGRGRKLERFGPYLLDRPAPAADATRPADAAAWREATARYERAGDEKSRGSGPDAERGRWLPAGALPESWPVQCGPLAFELWPSPFGHVGLFPEQASNWQWLAEQIAALAPFEKNVASSASSPAASSTTPSTPARRLKLLNLFAYTGGSTLSAAAVGAEVVHVDAAENIVSRARTNAAASGLSEAPIRWIVEDAVRFVEREVRRGNRYDAIVLDPPSYGHGPKGKVWRLDKQLAPLLELCGRLTADRLALVLLTCHSPGYDAETLRDLLADTMVSRERGSIAAGPLVLTTEDGRTLQSGTFARWSESGETRVESPE